MKLSDIAQHYLKYWHPNPDGHYEVSGNAPSVLLQFVVSQPKGTNRDMIHAALRALADPENPPADPSPTMALKWFAANPSAVSHCDEVLNAKRRPKSFNELVVRAYNAAAFEVVDRLHNFLLGQINKH